MRRPRRLIDTATLVALLSASMPSPDVAAQTAEATVTGVVEGGSLASLENAQVTATSEATGLSYGTLSNAEGLFWIEGLPPGTYQVLVSSIGHAPSTPRTIDLGVGQTVRLVVRLEGDAVALPGIVVETDAIESTVPDVDFRIDAVRARTLPEESRSFVELAKLAPGVTTAPDSPEPVASITIGGLNQYATGIYLDGVSLSGPLFNDFVGGVPLLALREFEVKLGSYSSAYGPAAGLINATTRRGSNEFEAEGFALFRDETLNATGAFETEKPDFRRLHVGAAVGGPIARDRTHFFAAYERKSADFFRTVLTGGAFPSLEGTFAAPLTDDLFFARVDHRLNDRHDLSVRWAGRQTATITGLGPDPLCGFVSPSGMGTQEFVSDTPSGMHSVLGTHTWSPQPNVQNAVRVHWLRNTGARRARSQEEARGYPSACRGGDLFQAESVTGRASIRNDLSWGVGRHRLQFGVSVARSTVDTRSQLSGRGTFLYDADDAVDPYLAIVSVQGLSSDEASTEWGVYAEDRWSVTDRLTLTLGLRYDAETNGSNQGYVSELAGVLPFVPTQPRAADLNNVAPRVGVAWMPTASRSVVLRGGLGVYYGTSSLWFGGLESQGQLTAYYPAPGVSRVEDLPVDPSSIAEQERNILGPDWDAVRTVQGSLGFDWAAAPGWVVTLEGLASKSTNLPIQRQVNGTPASRNYPGFGRLWQVLSAGIATNRMATLGVRRQTESHFLDLHYTLSRSESTNDIWFQSSPETDLSVTSFEGELGRSGWDERHRLVGVAGIDAPFGTRFGVKGVYSSPRPFGLVVPGDPNGDQTPQNDRPVSLDRNSGEAHGFASLDLSLSRVFRLRGGELEARINVFNVTNRTNFAAVDVIVGSPTFGEASGAFPRRQVEIGVQARY